MIELGPPELDVGNLIAFDQACALVERDPLLVRAVRVPRVFR
jgi:hypothetical protein